MQPETGTGEDAIAAASERAEAPAARGDDPLDLTLSRLPLNDYGNARRLIARFGDELMYVHGPGWFAWDGRRWCEDPSPAKGKPGFLAMKRAHKTALAMMDEIDAVIKEGAGAFPSESAYQRRLKDMRRHALSSGNKERLAAMINEAAPYLAKPVEDLDKHHLLFNVRNGTLDFSGGGVTLRRHRKQDYITHLAEVDYDPKAARPVFDAFMDTIMPDVPEQTFLQRYFGYCLTGDIGEQKLLLCFGKGGNGKSTLNNALRAVFGSYALGIQFETLQVDENRRGKDASPDIAELPGRRLVFAAEPEGSVRLSTAVIKRFTGGEPIKARKNFGDFFEFKYQFKLAVAFNDKPSVPAQDDGTWRRPLLAEFRAKIPDGLKDKQIDAKLAAEASGILNWLIDGLLLWKEQGLAPPESIVEATQQYRDENDPVGQFLREKVIGRLGGTITGAEFYEAYRKWSEDNGHRPLSNTKFGRMLPERGYRKDDRSGKVIYRDVEFIKEEEKSALLDRWGSDL